MIRALWVSNECLDDLRLIIYNIWKTYSTSYPPSTINEQTFGKLELYVGMTVSHVNEGP